MDDAYKNYGFIILITHQLKVYPAPVDVIFFTMATMTSYLKKTCQVRLVRRWFSDSAQHFQLDTTFKPFGAVQDIFDPMSSRTSCFMHVKHIIINVTGGN